VWITYLADKLKAGVMIAWPGVSGAKGFAVASSCGPEALWMMPEMPLPANKDGLAEITIISQSIDKILLLKISSLHL